MECPYLSQGDITTFIKNDPKRLMHQSLQLLWSNLPSFLSIVQEVACHGDRIIMPDQEDFTRLIGHRYQIRLS